MKSSHPDCYYPLFPALRNQSEVLFPPWPNGQVPIAVFIKYRPQMGLFNAIFPHKDKFLVQMEININNLNRKSYSVSRPNLAQTDGHPPPPSGLAS